MKPLLIILSITALFAAQSTLSATLTIGPDTVLNINAPISAENTVILPGGTLTGNGPILGTLECAGTLAPAFSTNGAFQVKSNFVGNGGMIQLSCTAEDAFETIEVLGKTSGEAWVEISSFSPAFSPQDLPIIYSGSSSDFSSFSAGANWLVRQESNNLLLHETAYDTDGDDYSDYWELVTGTSPTNSGESFNFDILSITNNAFHAAFTSITGRTYTLEYCTNLTDGIWFAHSAGPIEGDGTPMTFDEPIIPTDKTFYRIRISRN